MQAAKNKFVFPLLVLAAWTAFGLFFGAQNYLRDTYFGKTVSLTGDIIGWLLCGYSWAILTWPVLWFARRFSLARFGWLRFFAVHIPVGVVFSMAQLGVYDTIVHLLPGAGRFGFGEYYMFLLANELQSSFLVYFAVVAAVTAYDHFFAGRADRNLGESSVQANIAVALETAVDKPKTNGNGNGNAARRISVKENGRILLLDVDDIDWITSEGNYVQLHTPKKKYLIRETMHSMEAKLDAQEFVRLRRSTIVRVGEIKEFHPTFNGEFEVLLKSGIKLASSRRYRKNLEHLLKV